MSLYLTVCAFTDDATLQPLGDPHVFLLHDHNWAFHPPVLEYQAIHVPVAEPGAYQVVIALGHAPYDHDYGVCDMGSYTLPRNSQLILSPRIAVTCDNRDVIIRRPAQLEAGLKEPPRLRLGWRKMLNR